MAQAQFSTPNPRIWLELTNFSTVGHANNTGRFGEYSRAAGTGYTQETLLKFDVSSLSGATVTAVNLEITCNTKGSQILGATGKCFEQNKTNPVSWSNPPVFNDFVQTPWSNLLSSVVVQNTGVYNFLTSAGFVSLVQSWVDNSADNWGIIIEANFNAVNWWLSLDAATLTIDYTSIGGNPWYAYAQQ